MRISNKIEKIKIIHLDSFLSMIAVITRNTIPSIIFCVNTSKVLLAKILVKLGVTSTIANQAAERFEVTEDKAFRKDRKFLLTYLV